MQRYAWGCCCCRLLKNTSCTWCWITHTQESQPKYAHALTPLLLLVLLVLLQVVPGVRDMQMLQQRATGAEFVADNMQPA
jgi:hypothetical protein